MIEHLKELLGILLIVSGICNGVRYRWSALKIKEAKTAKGHSRKSMNTAIFDDTIKLFYGIVLLDFYLIGSALVCLIFMVYKWFIIYNFYPFRNRNLINFRKPSLWKYLINSLIPNNKRKRL